jgi:hypothetical protein
MEPKFRPIPITILDFFAILLPGFVWFILIVTTLEIALNRKPISSPIDAWQMIAAATKEQDIWLAVLSLLAMSVLIGYIVKPLAMFTSQYLTIYFFKLSARTKDIPRDELKFPYDGVYTNTEYYKNVKDFIEQLTRCSPEKLPGSKLFGAAKRYLRLAAPSLWEESERMETEVRMTGALFLACLYSALLGAMTVILSYVRVADPSKRIETWCWFFLSIITAFVLGFSFNRLRLREVGYTYLNALIASGPPSLLGNRGVTNPNERKNDEE